MKRKSPSVGPRRVRSVQLSGDDDLSRSGLLSRHFRCCKPLYQDDIGPSGKPTAEEVEMDMKVLVAEERYRVLAPLPPPTFEELAPRLLA
jgi:hypothetical protein